MSHAVMIGVRVGLRGSLIITRDKILNITVLSIFEFSYNIQFGVNLFSPQ